MKTKNQQFYADIQALLKKYRSANKGLGLCFRSDNDEPIKAIKVHYLWKTLWGWKEDSDSLSKMRLSDFVKAYEADPASSYSNVGLKPGKGENELRELLLSQDNIVSFKRERLFESGTYDLYIMTYFNKLYVGIRVKLVLT